MKKNSVLQCLSVLSLPRILTLLKKSSVYNAAFANIYTLIEQNEANERSSSTKKSLMQVLAFVFVSVRSREKMKE